MGGGWAVLELTGTLLAILPLSIRVQATINHIRFDKTCYSQIRPRTVLFIAFITLMISVKLGNILSTKATSFSCLFSVPF